MPFGGFASRRSPVVWSTGLLLLAFFVSLEARWYLTTQLPFIMDELVDTQLAVQVSRGLCMYSDLPYERMPLLTFVVAALHDAEDGSFAAAVAARRVFWVVMLSTVVGTWWVARNLLGPRYGLLAPALLLGFSNFLGSAIRVRADSLSALFSLPALWAITAARLRPLSLVVAGLSLGLAFGTTQKAVYYVAAFALALAVRRAIEGLRGWRWAGRVALDGLIAGTAFFVPLLAVAASIARCGGLEAFLRQTLLYGAEVGLIATTYTHTWRFVVDTWQENPGHWVLGVAGAIALAWEGARWRRAVGDSGTGQAAAGAALGTWLFVMLALLAQHTAKFPYVFLNVAPSLAICGAVLLARATRAVLSLPRPIDWRHIGWATAVLLLLGAQPVYHHLRAFGGDLLWWQKAVMDRVDSITRPEDAVFDGIGIATTRGKAAPWSLTARWFDERRAGAAYDVVGWIRRTRPKVVIINYRLDSLAPEELEFLRSRFVPDWANVWVAGAAIRHPGGGATVSVELVADAPYAVIARDPASLRIDGELARPVVQLAAGRHRLTVAGPQQDVILKYLPAATTPPPPERAVMSLFPSYSDP
jgi:hypothetical protein